MNILFMNSARAWGGNEKSVILAAHLLSDQHGVVLAYRIEEIGRHANCKKYRLPFLFEGDLYTIAQLIGIVKKHKINVIIPSKRKDYALAGIVSRLCGTTNILWLGSLRTLEKTFINNLLYNRLANGIIVNALQIKESLLASRWLEEKKISVVYNGIDTKAIDKVPITRTDRGMPMIITAMGRLDKNKSFDFLLRGFARFIAKEKGIDTELIIMGEGSERPLLENLIHDLNLQGKATLHGFTNNPYPILAKSHVFAMSSIKEGLSIALLEAMYFGNAPVSTYAGGGVKEIITKGKNGFLLEHGDENTLSSILYTFYSDNELRKNIAVAARKSVAERYASSRIKKEIASFCRHAIQRQQ